MERFGGLLGDEKTAGFNDVTEMRLVIERESTSLASANSSVPA